MPPYYTWTLTGRLCPKRLLLEQRGNYFTSGWPKLVLQKYEDEENNKDILMITMIIVWWWYDDKSTGNGCGQGCPTTDWLVSRTDSLSHIYCPRKTILIVITKNQIKVKVIMKIIIIEILKIKRGACLVSADPGTNNLWDAGSRPTHSILGSQDQIEAENKNGTECIRSANIFLKDNNIKKFKFSEHLTNSTSGCLAVQFLILHSMPLSFSSASPAYLFNVERNSSSKL